MAPTTALWKLAKPNLCLEWETRAPVNRCAEWVDVGVFRVRVAPGHETAAADLAVMVVREFGLLGQRGGAPGRVTEVLKVTFVVFWDRCPLV
jgi:hypothetical protein